MRNYGSRASFLALLVACIGLTACGDSDDSTQSPDLPPTQLNSVDVTCRDPATNTFTDGPIALVEGQTTQCTAVCTYRSVDKDGNINISAPGACDGLAWSAGACLNVTGNGDVTATCPSAGTSVSGVAEEQGDTVPFTVTAVTVTCSIVYPRGIADPLPPDPTCTSPGSFATTAPVGVTVPFRAAVLLSNGNSCYAPDAPAGFNACPQGLVTFAAADDPGPGQTVANFPNPPDGSAATLAPGESDVTATGSVNQVDLTVTAPQLDALCVESQPPPVVGGCAANLQNPVVCGSPVPDLVAQGAPFQFYAIAYYNVGNASSQACDVTKLPNTTWSINLPADAGSNAAANPSVADAPAANKGLVSGGDQATTGATVRASHTDTTGTEAGSHLFNVVINQVIANNSLSVSSELVENDPNAGNFAQVNRAACVASFSLLDGTPIPVQIATQARLYGVLRRCDSTAVQPDGSCSAAGLSTTLEDVTNAEPANNVPAGQIDWSVQQAMIWNTATGTCTAPTLPITTILGALLGDAALVGDDEVPMPPMANPRYQVGAAFDGVGDARIFGASGGTQVEDNGVAIGASTLSVGAACVTATYTEGGVSDTDGATVIVFPVNEGSVLLDPALTIPQALCDLVTPLLQ